MPSYSSSTLPQIHRGGGVVCLVRTIPCLPYVEYEHVLMKVCKPAFTSLSLPVSDEQCLMPIPILYQTISMRKILPYLFMCYKACSLF